MKIAYALHELVVKKERITPNSVIELEDSEFAELEALSAVRAAEDDEIAIAGLGKPSVPAAPKQTAAEKKAAAAAQKKADDEAAAAKKAEEDAGAADPEVVADPNAEADLLGGN